MFSLDPYEEIENTFTNLSIFTNKVSLVCSFALVKITQSAPLYYQLTKEFCNRGRGLTAEETASHSSITNFLTIKGKTRMDHIQNHAQDKYLIRSSWPKYDPPSTMACQTTPVNQVWGFKLNIMTFDPLSTKVRLLCTVESLTLFMKGKRQVVFCGNQRKMTDKHMLARQRGASTVNTDYSNLEKSQNHDYFWPSFFRYNYKAVPSHLLCCRIELQLRLTK